MEVVGSRTHEAECLDKLESGARVQTESTKLSVPSEDILLKQSTGMAMTGCTRCRFRPKRARETETADDRCCIVGNKFWLLGAEVDVRTTFATGWRGVENLAGIGPRPARAVQSLQSSIAALSESCLDRKRLA